MIALFSAEHAVRIQTKKMMAAGLIIEITLANNLSAFPGWVLLTHLHNIIPDMDCITRRDMIYDGFQQHFSESFSGLTDCIEYIFEL